MINKNIKVILIPGNGGASVNEGWLLWLQKELPKLDLQVIAKDFPDNQLARKKFWIPFIEKLGADKNTILIGHSSGAVASLKYAENHRIFGSVLVGVNYTDLGYEDEKQSGYYGKWNWEEIKKNQNWSIIFASTNDPFIPLSEPKFIAGKIGSKYIEMKDMEHFGYPTPLNEFPRIIDELSFKLL